MHTFTELTKSDSISLRESTAGNAIKASPGT
jgi:hypothetical protein